MVDLTGKTIEVIIIVVVFLFVLGIIIPVITWTLNSDIKCKGSVWLTANHIGRGLNCDTKKIEPTDKDLKKDNGALLVAKEMLACQNTFNAGSGTTILSYHPLAIHKLPIGLDGKIIRWDFGEKNYCFICAAIDFPSENTITNFDGFLLDTKINGQSMFSRLYEASPNTNRYRLYLDHDLNGPVYIIYSEGTKGVSGDGTGVSSGVVALDVSALRSDSVNGVTNANSDGSDLLKNLCGGSLASVEG